ncbi:MAG: nuclear transport factor 2 family protein, partial [Candidatus Lokiarchaeia archaeon]
ALSCARAPGPVDIEAERAQVKALLGSYVASVESEDMELYARNVSHDAAMVNFGAMGEPIVGWAALMEVMMGQNAALSETEIDVSDMVIHVSEDGKFAWATSLWNLKAVMGENPVELPVRCTWILEKQENRWVIIHFHKSVAMSG